MDTQQQRERQRWDDWAPTYDRSWFQRGFFRKVHDGVLEALSPAKGERILDVGCGTGNLAMRIAGQGARVAGADAAPAMLLEAASKGRGRLLGLVAAVAEQLPFAEGAFDAAVTVMSAHHWVDPKAGVGELARVLHPGGRVVLADIGRLGPLVDLLRRVFVANTEHHSGWTPAELAALLYMAGFRNARMRTMRLLGTNVVLIAADR
ncbi:MAG: methyltransferase domain-containing protein [Actinomycetota bacterium]